MAEQRFVFGYCVNEDGSRDCGSFPVEVASPDVFIADYTINGNILTIIRTDGEEFTVELTIPEAETEQTNFDATFTPVVNLNTRNIVFQRINDVDGTTSLLNIDIGPLMDALTSAPFPMFTAGDNVTITGNDVDGYVISSVDTDTDTFGTVTTSAGVTTITFPDGSSFTPEAPTPFECDELKALVNDTSCVPTIDTCDDGGDKFDVGAVEFLARRIVGGVAQLEAVNLDDIFAPRINTAAFAQNWSAANLGTITEDTGANMLDFANNPAHDIAISEIVIPAAQCRCTDTHVRLDAESRVSLLNSDSSSPNSTINVNARLVYDGVGPSRAPTTDTQASINTAQSSNDRDTDTRVNQWLIPINRTLDANGVEVCSIGPFRAQFRSNDSGVPAGGTVSIDNYILGIKLSATESLRLA